LRHGYLQRTYVGGRLAFTQRCFDRAPVDRKDCGESLRRRIDHFDLIAVVHAQHADDLVRIAAVDRNDVARCMRAFYEEAITQV
jgi:hypothetical protein